MTLLERIAANQARARERQGIIPWICRHCGTVNYPPLYGTFRKVCHRCDAAYIPAKTFDYSV